MIAALAGLFFAAFGAATLLPGASEAALAAFLLAWPGWLWTAIAAATLGNVLGSVVNWGLGLYAQAWKHHQLFPVKPEQLERYQRLYARWGPWSLLLSWAPVIGDPLTAIAGIMRTPLKLFLPIVALAKLARYLVIAGVVNLF